MANSTPTRKYPWPWTKAFTLEIFHRAVPELVALANATPAELETMPPFLKTWAPQARRIALALCGSRQPQMTFNAVPLPATFSITNNAVALNWTFPTVAELVKQEAQRLTGARAIRSLGQDEDAILDPVPVERVNDGVLRLLGAFTLLLALSADDRLRYRLKRCGLEECGRFFIRDAARSGADRKGGKRDFCPGSDHGRRWATSAAGRLDAAKRAKKSRSGT